MKLGGYPVLLFLFFILNLTSAELALVVFEHTFGTNFGEDTYEILFEMILID